ncbi:hypothetical protein B0H13DRAFT_1626845 [Mycena leptocephala]|nr:hypothetical protein B0H13DRAFT_1626845 [Mycena leptocephala]
MIDGYSIILPRFRILVSGVGKSSLINYAFGVDTKVSHQEHGVCDINFEITSRHNPLFVVHDSEGFEPGDVTRFENVQTFLQSRGGSVPLRDRVHAIWWVAW